MKKLTLKTFIFLLTIMLIMSSAAYLCILLSLPDISERQSRSNFTSETDKLISQLRTIEQNQSEELFADFIQSTGAKIFLLDESNQPVSPFTFRPTNTVIESGERFPFRFSGSSSEYILVACHNERRHEELMNAVLTSIPFVAVIILVLSSAGAVLFSGWTTAPIQRISKIANKIAELDFSWYCPDIRSDEIGVLSASINTLSDKLHSALDELNRQNDLLKDEIALEKEREKRRMLFFSGVSHELKTPIAIVIGQIEGMQAGIGVYKDREKYLARSSEILHSLNSFIKEILSVSHLDISDDDKIEAVDISDKIMTIAEEYSDYAEERAVTVSAETIENIIVNGDEKLLKKAFGNIIGNAVAYTSEGGNVKIRLIIENGAVLTVENAPAHIDEKHLPRLFDAFYRADSSYGHGSGLGLYITRMIFEKFNIGYKIENTANSVKFTVQLHTKNT